MLAVYLAVRTLSHAFSLLILTRPYEVALSLSVCFEDEAAQGHRPWLWLASIGNLNPAHYPVFGAGVSEEAT